MSELNLQAIREAIAARLQSRLSDCNVYAYRPSDGLMQVPALVVAEGELDYYDTMSGDGDSRPAMILELTIAPPAGTIDASMLMDDYRSCGTPHSVHDAIMDNDHTFSGVIRGDVAVLSSSRPFPFILDDGREALRSDFPLLIVHRKG